MTHSRTASTAQALCLIVVGTMPILAIMALVPILPQMLTHFSTEPQYDWLVPMILTVPSIVIVVFSSALGAVADFWGRRRLLLISLIAFAVLGVLPMWLDSLYAILATRLIVGLAEAGILTAVNALMGDYFEGENRKKWLSRQVMLGPLLASIYVLAGGALGTIDWRIPFLLYLIGLPLLAWAIAVLWEPQTAGSTESLPQIQPTQGKRQSKPTESSTFPWHVSIVIGIVTVVVALFFFTQLVQHGRIFSELGIDSPTQIGLLITLASLGNVIGGYIYGRMPRWPVGRMLALLLALYAIGYIGLSQAPNFTVGFVFDLVATVAGGLVVPSLLSWALSQYDFKHRGRGMGIWNGCFSLGQFLSAPFAALVGIGASHFLTTMGYVGVIALLLAGLAWAGQGWLQHISREDGVAVQD